MDVDSPKASKKKKKKRKKVKLAFRNYIPRCTELKKYMIEPAKPVNIIGDFEELITQAKRNEQDLSQIVPKKANWDLKRDVQPQLDRLQLLTKKAIREILKKRMEEAGEGEESGSESGSDSSGSGS